MATYKEIIKYVKTKYKKTIKTCWIADMKEICGLPVEVASNRKDIDYRENPCPEDKKEMIKEAFKHFNMI